MMEESNQKERFRDIRYVDRGEQPDLKSIFEKRAVDSDPFHDTDEAFLDKLDGEINIDLHGNMEVVERGDKGGIKEAGTYVLRNGKLVPGKGIEREKATFSNWYCSNADPEDIRRHRELMDRMNYRGPKWEGIGIPKSVLEEENPVYRKVDSEPHPSTVEPEKEGKKDFEFVVR